MKDEFDPKDSGKVAQAKAIKILDDYDPDRARRTVGRALKTIKVTP